MNMNIPFPTSIPYFVVLSFLFLKTRHIALNEMKFQGSFNFHLMMVKDIKHVKNIYFLFLFFFLKFRILCSNMRFA